jgi:hypothetical protein
VGQVASPTEPVWIGAPVYAVLTNPPDAHTPLLRRRNSSQRCWCRDSYSVRLSCCHSSSRAQRGAVVLVVILWMLGVAAVTLTVTHPSYVTRHQLPDPTCGFGTLVPGASQRTCVCDPHWASAPDVRATSMLPPCTYLRHGRLFDALLQFYTFPVGGGFLDMGLYTYSVVCYVLTGMCGLCWLVFWDVADRARASQHAALYMNGAGHVDVDADADADVDADDGDESAVAVARGGALCLTVAVVFIQAVAMPLTIACGLWSDDLGVALGP